MSKGPRTTGKRPRDRAAPAARPGAAGQGRTVIYGWHSAVAALRNPARQIERVLATRNALQRLIEEGEGIPNLPREPAEPHEIDRIAGPGSVHQGVAVLCQPLPDRDLDEFAEARLIIVLDEVTDPHNVGAIVRSAAAFGAAAVVMTERHAPAESAVLAKAASGGLEHVAIVRVKNLARALAELGDMGFLRLGLDSEFAEPLESVELPGRAALVLGAEGRGLRRLTREHCDRLVRLDLPGPIKSLNVSNAAALALYALNRPGPSGSGADSAPPSAH